MKPSHPTRVRRESAAKRPERLARDGAIEHSIVLAGALSENAWFVEVAHGAGLAVVRESLVENLPSWYSPTHGPLLLSVDGVADAAHTLPARIRERVVPVSWHQNWSALESWLQSGALDFIRMPAPEQEVVLRLRSAIARLGAATRTAPPASNGRERGLLALLSRQESLLYDVFKAHVGEVLNRQALRRLAWADSDGQEMASNVIDVYVCYLRGKLARAKMNATVDTVRGQGYVFRVHE